MNLSHLSRLDLPHLPRLRAGGIEKVINGIGPEERSVAFGCRGFDGGGIEKRGNGSLQRLKSVISGGGNRVCEGE